MRLRIFRAPRMADAIAQVRAALGEEAVILGSRRVADGVEVTAALEPPEPLLISPLASAAGQRTAAPGGVATCPGLQRHNLPEELAAALAAGPAAELEARLAGQLGFGTLPSGRPRPLLLAGPPGAGKTLTCVKIAARQVRAGLRPLIISTDHARAGAAEQMAAFTRLLGLMLALAEEPGTLAKARAHAAPDQPVLIDTEGCNPFDPPQARALLSLIRAAEAEVVLVLPAGLDPAEASELARGFVLLGARHLVPTRLDQARRLGGVLAAAAAGLTLTEAGTGPGAADGLTHLTPDWLAARLLAAGAGQQPSIIAA
jgi:flagellar biosynthesis protein FlhF